MRMKKFSLFFALFICAAGIFAHGKRDIEERDVAQMDSWQEEFDISRKKEGKYNAVVTVQDKGGTKL